VFNKELHPKDKAAGSYFTRSKYMNDYSHLFSANEIDSLYKDERQKLNIRGRFNVINFRANQNKYWNCATFAEKAKHGIRLWDIPWIRRRYEQDNDDTDEDESEEEEKNDNSQQPNLAKEIMKQAESLKKGPKQGHHLEYLTNLEEMMIKRVEMRTIINSQQVQELDEEGKPKQKFDYTFKSITKRKCAINEFIKPDSDEVVLPLTPQIVDLVQEATEAQESSSESDDEEFDWYDDS
jgi:hypothetical protein